MNKFIVFYDNWCPNCNRFKNFIKKVDSLNLIFFKELRNNIENKTFFKLREDKDLKPIEIDNNQSQDEFSKKSMRR